MWIHQRPNWTNFSYNPAQLSEPLAASYRNQGRLTGTLNSLPEVAQKSATAEVLISDVINTSLIEGEKLDPQEVHSSVARRLGLDSKGLPRPSADVEGIVEITVDANLNYQQPLTQARLLGWHAALFPSGRSGGVEIAAGSWRTDEQGPMVVVSGPMGRESVHYQAPDASLVPAEMAKFLDWFETENSIDQIIKAALAHFWFEVIHPFDDGNGRIGRAIADLALCRAHATPRRFYSLSAQIEADRKNYYRLLEYHSTHGSDDLTEWLSWFVASINQAIATADLTIAGIVRRSRQWQKISQHPINDRQHQVLNRILADDFEGHLSTLKYRKLAKCAQATALRDINDLLSKGILVRNPGKGKKASYWLAD